MSKPLEIITQRPEKPAADAALRPQAPEQDNHPAEPPLPLQNIDNGPVERRIYGAGATFITKAPVKDLLKRVGDKGTAGIWARFNQELRESDPDATILRQAIRTASALEEHARKYDIDLHGYFWPDPQALQPYAGQLTALFGQLALSPTYRAWQDQRIETFTAQLCTRAAFQETVRDWPTLTGKQYAASAAHIGNLQMKIFSENLSQAPSICAAFMVAARPVKDENARILRGRHMRPQGHNANRHLIDYNIHPDTGFPDAGAGLEVIFHENFHATQDMLGRAYDCGRIRRGHPLYRDARLLFLLFEANKAYVSTVKPVYHAHPLEEDAFRASRALVTKVAERLRRHGITVNIPAVQ